MNKKLGMMALALMVAVVMVASPLAFIGGSDNADAPILGAGESSVNGTYTIFVNDGSGWDSEVVSAYDGAQAVKASSFWTNTDVMANRTVTEWGYENLNASYGDITTFMGKTEDANNVWNVYVLIGDNWVLGDDAIGYYKCFNDYSVNWQTANIALQSGADTTAVPSSLAAYIDDNLIDTSSITQVSGEAFAVQFYLKNAMSSQYTPLISGQIYDAAGNLVTATAVANGVTIKGYGSDAYLALKNALGSANVVGEDTVPVNGYNHYSWIDKIFNMGTVQTQGLDTPNDWTDDVYAYWSQYNGQYIDGSASNILTPFVLGAYSPLATSPFYGTSFSLIYDEVAMLPQFYLFLER